MQRKRINLNVCIDDQLAARLELIAKRESRTLSEVARALLGRATTLYEEDGILFEGRRTVFAPSEA
jgi:hypothetical protein